MKATIVALALLAACGSDSSDRPVDAGPGSVDATVDGMLPAGFVPLVSRSWTLPAGATNTYRCTRVRVENELWVSGFRAVTPLGTHHTVLTISTNNTRTGDYDCTAGSLDTQMLYASGVGTDDLMFPPGVAMHIPAGTYVNLNLHLFNATDDPLANSSGVMVKVVDRAEVVHEADMMFSGTMQIAIPNDGMIHTARGGCTATADWHIFTLWPHMHQVATHQTWTYTHDGVPTTLLDDAFVFEEQKNYPIADTLIQRGDTIETVCSYVNNTRGEIGFGDGSDKEMCFTGMYKYPAGGVLFQCARP